MSTEAICQHFEDLWKKGLCPKIEGFLSDGSDMDRATLFRELLALELARRVKADDSPAISEYLSRFPGYREIVKDEFVRLFLASQPQCDEPKLDLPERYRIEERLGQGSFGWVFRAFDTLLNVYVAIKVFRVTRTENIAACLDEARTQANLRHPGIVLVRDVGRTKEGLCFLVSDFVDGGNLAEKMKNARLPLGDSVRLVATIADALHFCHTQDVFHRDVKPANILLDKKGQPFLADFGLALKDADLGKGPTLAGTLAYMSPEQARGSHQIDGRSDIFSLGVVLYELLTGRRPFRGNTIAEIHQATELPPRPPRQIDDAIPTELERICMKALQKNQQDRYSTAKDFSDDLKRWLTEQAIVPPVPRRKLKLATSVFLALFCFALSLAMLDFWDRSWGDKQPTDAANDLEQFFEAKKFVDELLNAKINRVPGILDKLKNKWALVEPLLQAEWLAKKNLPVALALLRNAKHDEALEFAKEKLLLAEPEELGVLRDELAPYRETLQKPFWKIAEQDIGGQMGLDDKHKRLRFADQDIGQMGLADDRKLKRLRALFALARFDPDNEKWTTTGQLVVDFLVGDMPAERDIWVEGFRPVNSKLRRPLCVYVLDRRAAKNFERSQAIEILGRYDAVFLAECLGRK